MSKTIKLRFFIEYIVVLFAITISVFVYGRIVIRDSIGVEPHNAKVIQEYGSEEDLSLWTFKLYDKHYSIWIDSSTYFEFASLIIKSQIGITVIYILSLLGEHATSRFRGSKSPKVYRRKEESNINGLIDFENDEDWYIDFDDDADMADAFERVSKSGTAKFARATGTNRFKPTWLYL